VAVNWTWTHSLFAASFVPVTRRMTVPVSSAVKDGEPLSVVETLVMPVKHVGRATTA
jgi:hypothetical protein